MAKELRFFYDSEVSGELPEEEAHHAARVLRLQPGNELFLMDGRGTYYRAELTTVSNHRCLYRVLETMPQQRDWRGRIHLAIAPTKLMDRMEWMAEKVTEVGLDELTFLDCQFGERRVVKTDRIDKILLSAMKQSHKAWKPVLNGMTDFASFIRAPRQGQKFICHCYDTEDVGPGEEKPFLMDVLDSETEATVMVGPEGDFSLPEVRLALENGWRSVSLGKSRLRTETAGWAAVHIMQIKKQKI